LLRNHKRRGQGPIWAVEPCDDDDDDDDDASKKKNAEYREATKKTDNFLCTMRK
jgi:hypothetical protein